VESGEAYAILSKDTLKYQGQQVNSLLESSMYNNGRPFNKFEDGGVFSTFGPITLNQSNSKAEETLAVLEGILKATGATATASETVASNSQSLGDIANSSRQTANKNFNVSITQINQSADLLNEIRSSASIRP